MVGASKLLIIIMLEVDFCVNKCILVERETLNWQNNTKAESSVIIASIKTR